MSALPERQRLTELEGVIERGRHQMRLLLADPTERGTWLPRDRFMAPGYLRDRKAETAIKTALGTLRQLEPGDGDGWLPAVLALEDALRRLRIRRAA